MPYIPSEEEWAHAWACLGEHYERVAARELDRIRQDGAIHESLLKQKRQREKEAQEKARAERMALVRTYDQAIRNGKPGLDYLPDQKCERCGGMPYFNGARFIEHHDRKICPTPGPQIVSGARSESTGLARVDASALIGRARRTGEADDND